MTKSRSQARILTIAILTKSQNNIITHMNIIITTIRMTNQSENLMDPFQVDMSDTDWIICRVQNGKFEGLGDASKLSEILLIFKNWAQS